MKAPPLAMTDLAETKTSGQFARMLLYMYALYHQCQEFFTTQGLLLKQRLSHAFHSSALFMDNALCFGIAFVEDLFDGLVERFEGLLTSAGRDHTLIALGLVEDA